MIGRVALILICIFGKSACAQVHLDNSQYAGTILGNDKDSPISYFVQSLENVARLERWTRLPLRNEKIATSSEIYDNFIVIEHPEGIVGGEINPRYSTFADNRAISELSKFMSASFKFSSSCVAIPAIVAKDGIKKTILLIYVLSPNEMEKCLESGFSIVTPKG